MFSTSGQNIVQNSAEVSVSASNTTQIVAALILGTVMLFGVGFASMNIAHNAAHDARHAFAFPCH